MTKRSQSGNGQDRAANRPRDSTNKTDSEKEAETAKKKRSQQNQLERIHDRRQPNTQERPEHDQSSNI